MFNAANEQAVALFLEGLIGFDDIARAIAGALAAVGNTGGDTRDALLAADARARHLVREMFRCETGLTAASRPFLFSVSSCWFTRSVTLSWPRRLVWYSPRFR